MTEIILLKDMRNNQIQIITKLFRYEDFDHAKKFQ